MSPEIRAIDGNVIEDAPDYNLFMRGKYILEAIFESLLEDHEMHRAHSLIMSGSSAGGLAIYIHADSLASQVRDSVRVKSF